MSKSGLADSPFFAPPPHKIESREVPLPATEMPTPEDSKPPLPTPTPEQSPAQELEETNNKRLEHTKFTDQPSSENKDAMETTMQPRINARKHANMQASNNASMHASNQSSNQESIVEIIRKVVKDVGKDSVTYRITPEEKKALLELSFSYKMQGFKTSENELIRIAINFLLEDQRQHGRNSVLQGVLDALNE
jgi:hypothetical protein